MIALAQIERAIEARQSPPRIMIRRIEINTTAEKKRKKMESKSDAKARRQYEFVDINQVHDSLVKFFTKTYGVSEKCKGHVIRIYLFIVALLGSDFSLGIPRVGPSTLWKNLDVIWAPLQQAYDPTTQQFNVKAVANNVIAPLLASVHKKHSGNASSKNITNLLQTIKTSHTLSEKAREAIPSVSDMACLVRNSNWVVLYWLSAISVPDCSKSTKYGFSLRKNGELERDPLATLEEE